LIRSLVTASIKINDDESDDQDESEDFAVLVKVAVEKKEEGNKCYKNQEYREVGIGTFD